MNKLFAFFILLSSLSANAMTMGAGVGYRLNDASSSTAGMSVDGISTFQVGGFAYIPMLDKLELRTGLVYTQRNYEMKVGVATSDAKLSYVDFPITAMYRLMEYGGLFGGINLAMKMSDDCGGSDCRGTKSILTPVSMGAFFMAAPEIGMELFFELIPGKITDDLEDGSAVGINFIINFD